ncbi:hypothetical protein BGZ61DRAFT_94585 [Ilyonectria robusta]|uniref:uncharacterized protein n=1 Tax=Ilyonectria robusta TaxID=1079257 RepID=UPI001E8DE9BF|nr:uncharacterized protein BGZ61DRAFT_94585 [Ilyonectria robusta]KAH8736410.1 hypothetical protein BGZ61DRAFT_94585 [Ilyonectria robusta]
MTRLRDASPSPIAAARPACASRNQAMQYPSFDAKRGRALKEARLATCEPLRPNQRPWRSWRRCQFLRVACILASFLRWMRALVRLWRAHRVAGPPFLAVVEIFGSGRCYGSESTLSASLRSPPVSDAPVPWRWECGSGRLHRGPGLGPGSMADGFPPWTGCVRSIGRRAWAAEPQRPGLSRDA